MPKNTYPLKWFDVAVNGSFMADDRLGEALTPALCQQIIEQAQLETIQQKLLLKEKSFELNGKQRRRFLEVYHRSLVLLYEKAAQNELFWQGKAACIEDALRAMTACLDEILGTFQTNVVSLPARRKVVTSPALRRERQQLLSSLAQIKTRFSAALQELRPVDILADRLQGMFSDEAKALTEGDLHYHRSLLFGLKTMPVSESPEMNQLKLLSLFIYFNFNSIEFVSYYTERIQDACIPATGFSDQLARLLFLKKQFLQLPKHPALAFDGHHASLETQIGDWFEQEIQFYRLKEELDRPPLTGDSIRRPAEPFKIICFLSVDQIALLLRSMDALRIFQAKSLNAVMQSIAPFLSTPVKADISWQSLRSKSYAPEEKDRQVAIKTLQAMIHWIQEY